MIIQYLNINSDNAVVDRGDVQSIVNALVRVI
ncbi:hypothetical protein MNBD_GAMMA08-826 [hydrothermal vent metagenome]|uniref:Uncharacterized protein n=1 Tax=hydrothermal vent metagenome TaxID=652676 RepID=A0A3B0X0S9_9ZZZZ